MKFQMVMRWFLFLFHCSISFSGFCQPEMIGSFTDLMGALKSGHEVRVVIHYAQCRQEAGDADTTPVPDVSASLKIDTWEFFSRNAIGNPMAFVVFSEYKLISHPKKEQYLYNYGKIKVFENNTATVDARYIHPRTFRTMMKQQYQCTIRDGSTAGGIEFYKH